MTAVDFFLADQNSPFLVAAAVMLGIGALEILSLVMGLGLSDLLDSLLIRPEQLGGYDEGTRAHLRFEHQMLVHNLGIAKRTPTTTQPFLVGFVFDVLGRESHPPLFEPIIAPATSAEPGI